VHQGYLVNCAAAERNEPKSPKKLKEDFYYVSQQRGSWEVRNCREATKAGGEACFFGRIYNRHYRGLRGKNERNGGINSGLERNSLRYGRGCRRMGERATTELRGGAVLQDWGEGIQDPASDELS